MGDLMGAFTTIIPRVAGALINSVRISYEGTSIEVLALWDTGASSSCIAAELSTALGMRSIGKRRILTPSGMADVHLRRIDVMLPNEMPVERLVVCDSAIGQQEIGMLIGMDVISRGDFATSCRNGRTMFTFRMPSQWDANFMTSH